MMFARTHVLVKGYALIRINEDGEAYHDGVWDECNIFPMTSWYTESMPVAFEDMEIDLEQGGMYSFHALLEIVESDPYGPHDFYVEHIEWKLDSPIEEYDKFQEEFNALGDTEDNLPF